MRPRRRPQAGPQAASWYLSLLRMAGPCVAGRAARAEPLGARWLKAHVLGSLGGAPADACPPPSSSSSTSVLLSERDASSAADGESTSMASISSPLGLNDLSCVKPSRSPVSHKLPTASRLYREPHTQTHTRTHTVLCTPDPRAHTERQPRRDSSAVTSLLLLAMCYLASSKPHFRLATEEKTSWFVSTLSPRAKNPTTVWCFHLLHLKGDASPSGQGAALFGYTSNSTPRRQRPSRKIRQK